MTEKINITNNRIEIEDDGVTAYFDFYIPIVEEKIDTYLYELREEIKMKKSIIALTHKDGIQSV